MADFIPFFAVVTQYIQLYNYVIIENSGYVWCTCMWLGMHIVQ